MKTSMGRKAALLVAGCYSLASASVALASDTSSPTVIELFTSQGCSSCPPAEEVLSELVGRPDVIALGFHVDYWDSSRWRDRFAMALSARRQRRYVEALGLSTAFTPQVIVSGHASFVGSDRRNILKALPMAIEKGIALKAGLTRDQLVIDLPDRAVSARLDVEVAAYIKQALTDVAGGENTGRRLREFDIVRSFRTIGTYTGAPQVIRVPLSSLPSDADAVAVLLQESNQGAIVAATMLDWAHGRAVSP